MIPSAQPLDPPGTLSGLRPVAAVSGAGHKEYGDEDG